MYVMILIFDRECMLKGLKESFVVGLVVVVESSSKNFPNQTKIVQGNKKCASVAHYGIELPCLLCMALCSLVCMPLCGLVCS